MPTRRRRAERTTLSEASWSPSPPCVCVPTGRSSHPNRCVESGDFGSGGADLVLVLPVPGLVTIPLSRASGLLTPRATFTAAVTALSIRVTPARPRFAPRHRSETCGPRRSHGTADKSPKGRIASNTGRADAGLRVPERVRRRAEGVRLVATRNGAAGFRVKGTAGTDSETRARHARTARKTPWPSRT